MHLQHIPANTGGQKKVEVHTYKVIFEVCGPWTGKIKGMGQEIPTDAAYNLRGQIHQKGNGPRKE